MKRSGLRLLHAAGIVALARALHRSRAVILTYHGVLSGRGGDDFLDHNFVAAEMFERQLGYICRYYRPTSLRDIVSSYEKGRLPPPRSVAVTFDDGFANNYSVAYPLLRRYSVPFTVFLTTGLIDRPGAQLWTERVKRSLFYSSATAFRVQLGGRDLQYTLDSVGARAKAARGIVQALKTLSPSLRNQMLDFIESEYGRPPVQRHERERYEFLSWAQIREMAAAGVDFGSHTVHHPILSTLDAATLCSEISESKQHIESGLGRPCETFAYPNGSAVDFGEREKVALRAAGYRCALSLMGRLNGPQADLFQLDRFNIGRPWDDTMFSAELAGVLAHGRALRRMVTRAPIRSTPAQPEVART